MPRHEPAQKPKVPSSAEMPTADVGETRTSHPLSPLGGIGPVFSPPQSADEIGRLGGFRILKLLGEGGMGMVFLAEDALLERQVALKIMKPHAAAQRTAYDRFLREARAAARLQHDNICPILQVGEERGVPYLAMPFLPGESFADKLEREGALQVSTVWRVARETAQGLSAAHAAGLIHRDIKPSNLWLERLASGEKFRVKVLDFGLARMTDETQLTSAGAVLGTPAYMSPEQARGEAVDARSDVFSLGAVAYHALSGRLPFPGDSMYAIMAALATTTPPRLKELKQTLPRALSDLVARMLEKDPAARPASALELVRELDALKKTTASDANAALAHATPAATNDVAKRAAPAPATKGRSNFTGVMVVFCLLAVGVGWFEWRTGWVSKSYHWLSSINPLAMGTVAQEPSTKNLTSPSLSITEPKIGPGPTPGASLLARGASDELKAKGGPMGGKRGALSGGFGSVSGADNESKRPGLPERPYAKDWSSKRQGAAPAAADKEPISALSTQLYVRLVVSTLKQHVGGLSMSDKLSVIDDAGRRQFAGKLTSLSRDLKKHSARYADPIVVTEVSNLARDLDRWSSQYSSKNYTKSRTERAVIRQQISSALERLEARTKP